MTKKYILAIDQGTTSSRSILFNHNGEIVDLSQKEFPQYFPESGRVEHDPNEIWSSQKDTMRNLIQKTNIQSQEVAAIGITNQRETTVVWDRLTGQPIYNAIVWQDRRTAGYCDKLRAEGRANFFQQKTGLVLDSYFSGTKLKWILDHVEGARDRAKKGELCFGTIDTWLVWKLTQGKVFVTDVSNASRTLLFNINTLEWDEEILSLFDIPKAILPNVHESSEVYGVSSIEFLDDPVPIAGIAGDQQAALFGQLCVQKGMVKNTYGTGCFMLMNTGSQPVFSKNNLLTTIAWKINGKTTYALEGSVFVGGSAVQWIRDGLELVKDASEIEELAKTVKDNGGVYFVPALTGLGAPHWDPYARGALFGLSRGTTKGHIARATLEGIAYQIYDVVKAMEEDAQTKGTQLRVDGGASANNLLLQFQSDIFGYKVVRPKLLETTALGAAYLAGLAVGFWNSIDELANQWSVDRSFEPSIDSNTKASLIKWQEAVSRSKAWMQ